MRKPVAVISAISLALVIALAAAVVYAANPISNGGFEKGTSEDWTVVNNAPDPGSSWYVYSGNRTPLTGHKIKKPKVGQFAAVTDMLGPGSHIIYQDFTVTSGEPILSMRLMYKNLAAGFATPDTLDPTVVQNQQYRVDLMTVGSAPNSMDSADILSSLFRTDVGDKNKQVWKTYEFDLSSHIGEAVRLRLAVVTNQMFLFGGADDITMQPGDGAQVLNDVEPDYGDDVELTGAYASYGGG